MRDQNNEWSDNGNDTYETGDASWKGPSTPRNIIPDEFTELPQFTGGCDC